MPAGDAPDSGDPAPGRRDGGRVVVVTGASSGIGRLAARSFASLGYRVVLASRSEASLVDAAQECEAAHRAATGRAGEADGVGRTGEVVLVVPTDVASFEEVQKLGRRAVERFGGPVDVWVNNAGVMAYGEVSELPEPVHRRVIDVNLFGTLYGSLVAARCMDPDRGGVIINMASLYGRMTSPYVGPYVASKFGVIGLSHVLREELTGTGIDVCTVLPGSMDTPIFRHAANYVGRQPKPVPPVSNPDRVARKIVELADRPRAEVTIGQTHRALAWTSRLAPNVSGGFTPPAMRWLGLGGSRKLGVGNGNVFEPKPEWNWPSGDWRSPRTRIAIGLGVAAGAAAVAKAGLRRGLVGKGRSGRRR